MNWFRNVFAGMMAFFFCGITCAEELKDVKLADWQPQSMLVVKQTKILKAKFPVIDFHSHLRNLDKTQEYLKAMDDAGVWKCISLDGFSKNDFYKQHLKVSQEVGKGRFIVFFVPDFDKIDGPDFGKKEAAKLSEATKMGVRGVKIFKALGLKFKDKSGKLIAIDDPRIDPIWSKCGELGIPVLIHSADPAGYWTPPGRFNERMTDSNSYYGPDFPSKDELLAQRERVIARHPDTIFVGAHVANMAENLDRVSKWFDRYPNLYADMSAGIIDLGRQPYSARKFIIKYQDRLLYGSDAFDLTAEEYRSNFRFFETDDEFMDMKFPWKTYGIYLPDEVLEKIYNKNAMKILAMFKGEKSS
jgi:predicted TIM-barrel fold metal-dependent hydrolase